MTISVVGTRIREPKADDIDIEEMGNESLIESTFLGGLDTNTRNQIEGATDFSALPSLRSADSSKPIVSANKKYNRENVLGILYEVYDDMVEYFESMEYSNPIAKKLSNNIVRLGSCIREVGGEIEKFSPLDHVSGLSVPPMLKNAKQVISRTRECYKRAEIEHCEVSDSGKVVSMTFLGTDENLQVMFRAAGTITADSWSGTEAIDYVYTPASGKMSVKVLEDNKWTDKSANYKIHWELAELDLSVANEEDINLFRNNKKAGDIKGAENNLKDNTEQSNDTEGEVDLDFPIEEK